MKTETKPKKTTNDEKFKKIDNESTMVEDFVDKDIKPTKKTKKKHNKSNSNVEKYIQNDENNNEVDNDNDNEKNKDKFSNTLKNNKNTNNNNNYDDIPHKYENFVNNFDDLVLGIKTNSKPFFGKTTENTDNYTLTKPTQSAVIFSKHKNIIDPSIITQVDKKEDKKEDKTELQNLTNIEEIKDFYDYTENCLVIISKMKIPSLEEIEHLRLELPSKLLDKKLAIFDLDETLIHCELKNIEKADKIISIKLKNGNKTKVGINIRPYIFECLKKIQKYYNMIIFTASDQQYADAVINLIDQNKDFFKFRLYRHNCFEVKIETQSKPIYVKDLRIIKNIPLENMLLIDNSVLCFAYQLDNGIPILPYYNNKDDKEMEKLENYLIKIAKLDDLKLFNGATFNLKALLEETSISVSQTEDISSSNNKQTLNDNNVIYSKRGTVRRMSNIGNRIQENMEKANNI